jgi:hypothetical protein
MRGQLRLFELKHKDLGLQREAHTQRVYTGRA